MSYMWVITVMFGIYCLGTMINVKTRGTLSSAIFIAAALLIGYWTGFLQKDFVDVGNLTGIYAILNLTILVHIGTTFDIRQVAKEWKLVVMCLLGLVGMGIMVIVVGGLLFGKDMAIASYPSLTGGVIATNMVAAALKEIGKENIAAIVVLVFSVQVWAGILLVSNGSKKECARLLALFREGNPEPVEGQDALTEKPKLIDRLPEKYDNPFLHLFLAAAGGIITTYIATFTAAHTGGVIGFAVIGILVGILLRQFGLISKAPLQRAGMMDILMFALIYVTFSSLSTMTPSYMLHNIGPILGVLLLGTLGMGAVVIIIGRRFGFQPGLALAIGFGCYTGYPLNYQVVMDVIKAEAKTEEERQYLTEKIVGKIVLGSIISVSIASVVIAGVVLNYL